MVKHMIGAIICLLSLNPINAQDPDLYFRDQQLKKQENERVDITPDSIIHKSGLVLKKGSVLKIGAGTMPDGSFKYVRINEASMMGYYSYTQNAANAANALPPSFSGRNSEIAKLQKRGNKKFGYQDYAIIKIGAMARYEVDIDNAILSGEIDVPDEFKPKGKVMQVEIKTPSLSVADELVKLKKLLDDGILTKEEFESMKKKLLEKKEN
ncbi:SHOCT domain-containing protein [Sediminibacterium sp.]|uniref:SHOCT domain-containing protein n=1 Tax=Sediminibacterium sp. TaxID=1917865 RepID=UPI003F69E479